MRNPQWPCLTPEMEMEIVAQKWEGWGSEGLSLRQAGLRCGGPIADPAKPLTSDLGLKMRQCVKLTGPLNLSMELSPPVLGFPPYWGDVAFAHHCAESCGVSGGGPPGASFPWSESSSACSLPGPWGLSPTPTSASSLAWAPLALAPKCLELQQLGWRQALRRVLAWRAFRAAKV